MLNHSVNTMAELCVDSGVNVSGLKKIKAGLVSKFDTQTHAYEEPNKDLVQRLESVEHTHCSLKVQKKINGEANATGRQT